MCPNCGTKLTCGCQKRVASNGQQVCQNCITAFEVSLQSLTITPKVTISK